MSDVETMEPEVGAEDSTDGVIRIPKNPVTLTKRIAAIAEDIAAFGTRITNLEGRKEEAEERLAVYQEALTEMQNNPELMKKSKEAAKNYVAAKLAELQKMQEEFEL